MLQNLSSAAVVIGALRVKTVLLPFRLYLQVVLCIPFGYLLLGRLIYDNSYSLTGIKCNLNNSTNMLFQHLQTYIFVMYMVV